MHRCSMGAIQPLLYMYSNTYICYFYNFIPTYHLLHAFSRQTLLCARLAACHVPLVYYTDVNSTYTLVWCSLNLLTHTCDEKYEC